MISMHVALLLTLFTVLIGAHVLTVTRRLPAARARYAALTAGGFHGMSVRPISVVIVARG